MRTFRVFLLILEQMTPTPGIPTPFVFLMVMAAFLIGKLHQKQPRHPIFLLKRTAVRALAPKTKPVQIILSVLIAVPMMILVHVSSRSQFWNLILNPQPITKINTLPDVIIIQNSTMHIRSTTEPNVVLTPSNRSTSRKTPLQSTQSTLRQKALQSEESNNRQNIGRNLTTKAVDRNVVGLGHYPWGHVYKARVWCAVPTMWPEKKQNIEVQCLQITQKCVYMLSIDISASI